MRFLLKSTLFSVIMVCLAAAAQAWEPLPEPPATAPLAWVTADPETTGALWAASAHELFHTKNLSRPFPGWREAGALGGPQRIRRLLTHQPDEIFILTETAVFLKRASAKTFEPVFTRSSESAAPLLSFAAAPWEKPMWFAGTADGLFVSKDRGKTWSPHFFLGHSQPVSFLASSDSSVFILVARTLYRAASPENASAVFHFGAGGSNTDHDENEPAAQNDPTDSALASSFEPVFLTHPSNSRLWLTSPQGIAESHDEGLHWQLLPKTGFSASAVRALVYSKTHQILFAAAGARVYAYQENTRRWAALPQTSAEEILSLSLQQGSPENLVAAVKSELLSHPVLPDQIFPANEPLMPPEYETLFLKQIAREPSPRAVQKEVVRYSNLTNDKIRRWHKESRLRALLPTFSFGRDFGVSSTLDLDRGGTADPDRYIAGPDETNWGWDADVRWDLGDLIWSPSQTSIDIREKLMVDQRRDFLAEAMRVYFERRRLQTELFFSSSNEVRRDYEKQLRLEELTALLDAMTGGWFSRELEKNASSL